MQKVESVTAVSNDKMTSENVLVVFKERLEENPSVKPKTKECYGFRMTTLLKSWPGLEDKNVSRITSASKLAGRML